MHASLHSTAHRPWPLPASAWVWRQRWTDLAFFHWPVPVAAVRPHVPETLEVETRGGWAWLGIVPFALSDFGVRQWPAIPLLSPFLETNLRTYVTDGRRPGVWFFRMDASRVLAVLGARAGLGLPYAWSDMAMEATGTVRYRISGHHVEFSASYGPAGPVVPAEPGSLESFLTERYCLYARHAGALWRLDIHHAPWPLQAARAKLASNTIGAREGWRLTDPPPLVHYAARQDVIGWLPQRVRTGRTT